MESNSINTVRNQLIADLREKNARLKELEEQANNLQIMITAGRRDADFDLFYRRFQMTEIFASLPAESLKTIYLKDFYTDFWKLAGEAHRVTKFAEEERDIAQQIFTALQREKNSVRRQYLALLLILFGEIEQVQSFFEQNLWPLQLKQDFATFSKWHQLANNSLSPQTRAKIEHNEQIFDFLQEKYSALIKKYSQAVFNEKTCSQVKPEDYHIYFCWLQGEENFPPIVRCCYNSLKQNAGRYKIVFIDEKNFSNYVDIAPHIMNKFRTGKISRTHFSDILRVNLLERYGGLWLDSTILVTDSLNNHNDSWQLPFYTTKWFCERDIKNPVAKNISFGRWATYVQGTAIRHNPLFTFGKEFYNEYWHDYDEVIDYYLMDFMISLAYENISFVRNEIDNLPINDTLFPLFQNHLNDTYKNFPYDKIFKNTFLHKLSWKIKLDMTTPGTVFREIQRRYAPETLT